MMTPFELIPPIKDYIWGGTRLREEYGKQSDYDRLAESWELSCHKDGHSIIANGEYSGKTLSYYLAENPLALGTDCGKFKDFPVLIKLIDARDKLSVQVHPDNSYAQRVEGEYGKTEMWYIIDCEEGAELIYGFRRKLTKDEFRRAVEENSLLDEVKRVKVKKGDVFFIEPGTLHAIGEGILIAEIQQNSNTTYRVYDYGRTGADGNPRELHIEKALEVAKLSPARPYKLQKPVELDGRTVQLLADCEYFTVSKHEIKEQSRLCADTRSFNHVLAIEGEGCLISGNSKIALKKGSSVFVPAGTGTYDIKGKITVLVTEIKELKEEI